MSARTDRPTRRRRRRGAALLLVIFAVALISVFAVAMLDASTTDLAIMRNHASGLQASYAARAGVAKAFEQFREDWDEDDDLAGSFTGPGGETYTYHVSIDKDNHVMTVVSTGTAAGFTRRIEACFITHGHEYDDGTHPVTMADWQEKVGF